VYNSQNKAFCCQGCRTVYELLAEHGLTDFYRLGNTIAGVRVASVVKREEFAYLDDPAVRRRLVDFADDRITRVTFRTPAMHCIACVWLLENLFRLQPGVGQSRVDFPRKEVSITFENARVSLGEVGTLLASLGDPPELKLSDLDAAARPRVSRRLWLQLGVAGFAFGNIMLFSLASYLGMDGFNGPALTRFFGWMSFALALPVLTYSASDYWRAAWRGLRRGLLTIEVPIALGIAALSVRSAFDVWAGRGGAYFDSLSGLVFFLLCGRLFQQKTYDRLAFDLDYRSFFPLSITRKRNDGEQRVSLSQLEVGDRIIIRNGELIPSDARLLAGPAVIDYSFVTGESEPVEKQPGDHLFAGGRQTGGTIEIETLKAVSQSYLTSLWNQQAFRKSKGEMLDTMINRYSRIFTKAVIAVAVGSAVFWCFRERGRALVSFTSVLIVACPCALALAAPFTLGTAQRLLARRKIFVRNTSVIETLARVNTVVLDKTGTLTAPGAGSVVFHGEPLNTEEAGWIFSLTRHSTHPSAVRVSDAIALHHAVSASPVRSFSEQPGAGMQGVVAGHEIWMGSAAWLASRNLAPLDAPVGAGSVVHLAIDGRYRGAYTLTNTLRPQTAELISRLAAHCDLALLSGDNERERDRFRGLFGPSAHLSFNQSPLGKLGFIRDLQQPGKTVMMVGDGLNDAGALQQSDVGVAVVESVGAFSPASDVIMAANMVPRLADILRFSKKSVLVVRLSILLSAIYNVVGISIAARGQMSPVICAILMPLSSITVVVFACALTNWLGLRAGLDAAAETFSPEALP
jgi:Cu+-exporting ATPase